MRRICPYCHAVLEIPPLNPDAKTSCGACSQVFEVREAIIPSAVIPQRTPLGAKPPQSNHQSSTSADVGMGIIITAWIILIASAGMAIYMEFMPILWVGIIIFLIIFALGHIVRK